MENTECMRSSAHILNIFIEKINRVRRVWFPPHVSRTVKVSCMILVLSSENDCVHGSARGNLNI